MRKLFALAVPVVATLAVLLPGSSDAAPVVSAPPTVSPTVAAPRPKMELAPRITGFRFQGGNASRQGPLRPLPLELEIHAPGNVAQKGTLKVKSGSVQVASGPFEVTGGQKKAHAFIDSIGLQSACVAANYDLELFDEQGESDTKKNAKITANCIYTIDKSFTWGGTMPDRIYEMKQNKVFFDNASVDTSEGLGCGKKTVWKATVKNNKSTAVSGISMQVSLDGNVRNTSAVFDLAPGATKNVEMNVFFQGDPGTYRLGFTSSTPGPTVGPTATLTVGRGCNLTAAMVD